MLHKLQKYKKKTFLLPNAHQEAAEKQAFIEGPLMAIGLDPTKVTAEGKILIKQLMMLKDMVETSESILQI